MDYGDNLVFDSKVIGTMTDQLWCDLVNMARRVGVAWRLEEEVLKEIREFSLEYPEDDINHHLGHIRKAVPVLCALLDMDELKHATFHSAAAARKFYKYNEKWKVVLSQWEKRFEEKIQSY